MCTGFDPVWDRVISPWQQFPVAAGTGVTVACEEPYELRGEQFVTCVEGTTFTFTSDVAPYCEGKQKCYQQIVEWMGFDQ